MTSFEKRIARLKKLGNSFFYTRELLDRNLFEPVDTMLLQLPLTKNAWWLSKNNIFGKECHGIVKKDGIEFYAHLIV